MQDWRQDSVGVYYKVEIEAHILANHHCTSHRDLHRSHCPPHLKHGVMLRETMRKCFVSLLIMVINVMKSLSCQTRMLEILTVGNTHCP